MKCSMCGANIEVTEFEDGTVLIRQDCLCDLKANENQKAEESKDAVDE